MTRRTADWLVLLLGGWLVLSPWILGYGDVARAAGTGWVIGVALIAFALVAIYTSIRFPYQERFNYIVLGLFLLFSPWLLGFTVASSAVWNAVVVGLLVAGAAVWALSLEGSPDRRRV